MTTHFQIIDAHVHLFLPEAHPYSPNRSYTPGTADIAQLTAHLEEIDAEKVVIVQPSPYHTDNAATLEGMVALGRDRARGIAVVDPFEATPTDVQHIYELGFCGLRANLKTSGIKAVEDCVHYLVELNALMKGTNLLMEVFLPAPILSKIGPTIRKIGRPVLLDHFGGLNALDPNFEHDVECIMDILTIPNTILKASAACRVTNYSIENEILDKIAPALFEQAAGRTVWGSDWPHTGKSSERIGRPLSELEPFMKVDDNKNKMQIRKWAGSEQRYNEIMWDTPNELFGF